MFCRPCCNASTALVFAVNPVADALKLDWPVDTVVSCVVKVPIADAALVEPSVVVAVEEAAVTVAAAVPDLVKSRVLDELVAEVVVVGVAVPVKAPYVETYVELPMYDAISLARVLFETSVLAVKMRPPTFTVSPTARLFANVTVSTCLISAVELDTDAAA